MNTALVALFNSGFWLRTHVAVKIAHWIVYFLKQYQKAALLCFHAGKSRYALIPKLHFIHHAPIEMLAQSRISKWVVNPLATSCQMQESYIGMPSRASRRVSIRQIHLRTLQRCLLLNRDSFEKAWRDPRGMDAYPDSRQPAD